MIKRLVAVILTVSTTVLSAVTVKVSSSEICVLPPYPSYGNYVSKYGGAPGDKLNNYILNVTCMPGYKLVGDEHVTCLTGRISGSMPICVPYCKADYGTSVTCGDNTPCCYFNPSLIFELRSLPPLDTVCGHRGVTRSYIIAGGHSADVRELPWHAGIYKKTSSPYMQICGGSLISTNVIISAAHCFWSDIDKLQPAKNYAVAVGKLYRPWNNERDTYAQKSDVKEILIPDRFHGSATNFQDDIAVVIAATEFSYNDLVKPVCLSFDHQLDEKQLQEGNSGMVGGWGLTGEDSKPSQVLQAVSIPYVDIKKCITESPPAFTSYITSDKICAGYQNGTAVCKGDSGGGLVFGEQTEYSYRYFLRGIVSTAPSNDHLCNVFAWGTFTHVVSHERFIKSILRRAGAEAPETLVGVTESAPRPEAALR